MPTKAVLELQLQEAQEKSAMLEAQLENIHEQVAAKAMELADDHGWCGIVEEALHELGIAPKRKKVEFYINVRFHVSAMLSEHADRQSFMQEPAEFLGESLRVNTDTLNSGGATIELDNDYENVRFDRDWDVNETIEGLQITVVNA